MHAIQIQTMGWKSHGILFHRGFLAPSLEDLAGMVRFPLGSYCQAWLEEDPSLLNCSEPHTVNVLIWPMCRSLWTFVRWTHAQEYSVIRYRGTETLIIVIKVCGAEPEKNAGSSTSSWTWPDLSSSTAPESVWCVNYLFASSFIWEMIQSKKYQRSERDLG